MRKENDLASLQSSFNTALLCHAIDKQGNHAWRQSAPISTSAFSQFSSEALAESPDSAPQAMPQFLPQAAQNLLVQSDYSPGVVKALNQYRNSTQGQQAERAIQQFLSTSAGQQALQALKNPSQNPMPTPPTMDANDPSNPLNISFNLQNTGAMLNPIFAMNVNSAAAIADAEQEESIENTLASNNLYQTELDSENQNSSVFDASKLFKTELVKEASSLTLEEEGMPSLFGQLGLDPSASDEMIQSSVASKLMEHAPEIGEAAGMEEGLAAGSPEIAAFAAAAKVATKIAEEGLEAVKSMAQEATSAISSMMSAAPKP